MLSLRFSPRYFILTLAILAVEVFIGLYMHDDIVRPYGGDFLVVILIYCFVRSLLDTPVVLTAIAVLTFACTVEISQYFHLVNHLGLEKFRTARLLLGTSFSFTDIAAYTSGILLTVIIESIRVKRKKFNDQNVCR